jgi:oligopeptide transport system substrate-binding protein
MVEFVERRSFRRIAMMLRRNWFTQLAWLFVVLVTAFALAAPADAAKSLRRGNGAEPKGLDPHHASGDPENQIFGDLFLGLYTEDNDGNPVLGAAESATTSPDGRTWTFKIRDHKWSDGTPVTAEDFVYAYRRILNPNTASEYANILYPIKNAQGVNKGELKVEQLGVSAPDPKTFVIELDNPAPFLPEMLMHYTCYPLPRGVIEKYGVDWTKPGKMVSNGPYMLAERRANSHIKMVKNQHFYDAANVKIDEVWFYPSADGNAALKAYRAGELDVLDRWPLTEHKWLLANIPNETRKYTGLRVTYTVINTRNPPLNDKRVRMALALAIDTQAIQSQVFFNQHGIPAFQLLPPGTANADLSARVPWVGKSMDERRKEARELLQQAGFGPGKPLKLTYNYINSGNDAKRQAVAMQAMWKQIGVDIEIMARDFAIHYDMLKTSNFQLSNAGWIFDYNDANSQLFLFESANETLNYPGYKNPEYDRLMQQAAAEPDAVARGKMLGQASQLVMNDVAIVPTFFQFVRPLVKSYVLNWKNNPRGTNRTRWLDIGDKPGPEARAQGPDTGVAASEGGFWSWLGSWFSPEAWSKWWNS